MQKITLNLIPDGVPPVVYVNQFDTGREFQISFKEGLAPYNFPSGVVFRINGRKADNHVFEYTESDKWDATHNIITKSGSGTSLTVTIATSEQMTAAAGNAEVQLTIKSSSASNDILGTLNFILAVQEKPDANGDPSESDLPDRVESVNGIGPDTNGNVLLPPALGAIGAHNIAPVEPTRIMSTARAAGTKVYVTADDQLYDIISPIGVGGTLTPGTNAIASSISSDLASKATGFPIVSHSDSARVINSYGQTYTATEDCWLNVFCKASGSKDLQLFVDGQVLIQLSANTNDTYGATFPIKARSQISSRNDSASGSYLVYKWAIQ